MATNPKLYWSLWSGIILFLLTILFYPLHYRADGTNIKPVIIGFDAEQGNLTSTSDDAIRIGILTASMRSMLYWRGGLKIPRQMSVTEFVQTA